MSSLSAAPRAWSFPAAAAPGVTPRAALDPLALIEHLTGPLTQITGVPVGVRLAEAIAPLPTATFIREDGFLVSLALPAELAAAIVGFRCGGGFVCEATAGASGVAVERELEGAVLAAAGRTWTGPGGWSSAALPENAVPFAITITAAGIDFVVGCAVVAAPPPADLPAVAPPGWARDIRSALDATPFAVRAVLHERAIPLAEALALRVGDVLPIETHREVSLRVEEPALARGTITPDDDGGHRVTIVALGRGGVTPAPHEELP